MDNTNETVLISCLLSRPELINRVMPKIKPEYFDNQTLRRIYNTMLEMKDFTTPRIAKELNIKVTDLIELNSIYDRPTAFTCDSYGYAVFEDWKTRQLKNLMQERTIDFDEINRIIRLKYFEEKRKDESEEFLKNVESVYRGDEDLRTIKTGFYNIDNVIGGFKKSEAIFLGARPGVGKTTIGMNIAYNMAKSGKKVLFCSIEMSAVDLHSRLVLGETGIKDYKNMSDIDFQCVIKASKDIKSLPIDIYDKAGLTIEDITYRAKSDKYDVIFIDHLSILKSAKSFKNRYEEITYLSGEIKVLARDLDIPVVCLCQLNRQLESREIKAPSMADIRDSGSVEQDGDIIAFLYRPEYHLKDKEPDNQDSPEHVKWESEMQQLKNKAQLIISKNRRGWTGKIRLSFDGSVYKFYDR